MKKFMTIALVLLLASCETGAATASEYWTGGEPAPTEQQQSGCE